MTKRLVDIDDVLLDGARQVLGADTIKDTVNGALEEVVRLALRRRHIERLAAMDGLELDDAAVMEGAWRTPPD